MGIGGHYLPSLLNVTLSAISLQSSPLMIEYEQLAISVGGSQLVKSWKGVKDKYQVAELSR